MERAECAITVRNGSREQGDMLVREITVRNGNQKYGTLSENRDFTATTFVAHKVAQSSRGPSRCLKR